MTNTYTESNGNNVSTTADDIITDTDSTIGNENVWRIRGGAPTAGNGWSTNAPQYTQGAQFDTTTAGYSSVILSFNWAATAQGVQNLQVQYNTNVNNASGWTNVGPLLVATVANSSTGGLFQTDTIDFGTLGITSVNNDPNFGVRLVSAFNPNLAGGTEYASASTLTSPEPVQRQLRQLAFRRRTDRRYRGAGTAAGRRLAAAVGPGWTWALRAPPQRLIRGSLKRAERPPRAGVFIAVTLDGHA